MWLELVGASCTKRVILLILSKKSFSLKKMKTSILFLVFNRIDTTRQAFQKIRDVKPPRLYVAADGSRSEGERKKCEQVRKIATDVDWECEVKTLFRDQNLGCKMAVSGGIDWFFENEEMGIILEDDCLPDESFFYFCEELLHKYKNENKVMTISGNNFQTKQIAENSYYFSKYMHCWGWASWRRAWNHNDLNMEDWPKLKKEKFLPDLFSTKRAQIYWLNKFNNVYAKKIDTWDYQWQYSIWKENGINILPKLNLVTNIGFGEDATHTKNPNSESAGMKRHKLKFPLEHPSNFQINYLADEYTQKNIFNRLTTKKAKIFLENKISNFLR